VRLAVLEVGKEVAVLVVWFGIVGMGEISPSRSNLMPGGGRFLRVVLAPKLTSMVRGQI